MSLTKTEDLHNLGCQGW